VPDFNKREPPARSAIDTDANQLRDRWVDMSLVNEASPVRDAEAPPSGAADHSIQLPAWAEWTSSQPYTVGLEEEVMLLDRYDGLLVNCGEQVLRALPPRLGSHASAETHEATVELASAPHRTAKGAACDAAALRHGLAVELAGQNILAASAGTHPLAHWTGTKISRGARYKIVYESMRELARREPTFGLHVHVGVADADKAIVLQNRLRAHLPLLLALSVNSPFWQGRDTGFASARTPIFQAFPRVGVPGAFRSYSEYVEAVDQLLRCGAFPGPTFLWWDVRLQAGLGTVETRVMDAQTTVADTLALVALVQTIAHLELEEGYQPSRLNHADEVIHENRFLAARDGMSARFIDPVADRRVSAVESLHHLLRAARSHAAELGCEDALAHVAEMAHQTGASRQRQIAKAHGVGSVAPALAELFAARLAR
jgi:glutamate---cysteine ligase / carboxylate-amine ligase